MESNFLNQTFQKNHIIWNQWIKYLKSNIRHQIFWNQTFWIKHFDPNIWIRTCGVKHLDSNIWNQVFGIKNFVWIIQCWQLSLSVILGQQIGIGLRRSTDAMVQMCLFDVHLDKEFYNMLLEITLICRYRILCIFLSCKSLQFQIHVGPRFLAS